MALGEVLAVAGDHEQRVVDPDAEPDHRPDHAGPSGDVHGVGHEGERAAATARPTSAVPIGSPMAIGTERHQQDDDRDEQPGPFAGPGGCRLEGEVQVAAGLDPQLGRGTRRSSRADLRLARSAVEVLGLGVLDPDQRDLALGRDADSTAETRGAQRQQVAVPRMWGSAARASWTRATSACARGVERRGSRGVTTTSAPSPISAGVRPLQEFGGPCESSPGASNGSSSSRPKAAWTSRGRERQRPSHRSRSTDGGRRSGPDGRG